VNVAEAQRINLDDLTDLHIVPLAGHDAVMGAPEGKTGIIKETPIWRGLVSLVKQVAPRLVILDTLADVFAGNEIARQEARQFIGILRGLAIEYSLAVVLLAHPSLSGMASGSGTSGSTAWSNSVRSRLYLETVKTDDGNEIDSDLRVLRTKKANYGPTGAEIRLRWSEGRFVRETPSTGLAKLAADANADRIFLDLLEQFTAEGRNVCANPGTTYAPRVFAVHANSKGVSVKALTGAMDRLMADKKIKVEMFGPPSRQRSKLVISLPKDGGV
jgi:RecA-family ATPase